MKRKLWDEKNTSSGVEFGEAKLAVHCERKDLK